MRSRAFRHARHALEDAKASLAATRRADSFEDYDRHWRAFVRNLLRIWHKLEGAAAGHRSLQAIKSRHEHAEKKDPLLHYLSVSRNSEEHSVREVARFEGIGITPGPGGFTLGSIHVRDGKAHLSGVSGQVLTTVECSLLPVRNRTDVADPPTEHLGKPLADCSVFGVANAGLDYFEALIAEVEAKCS
jgi:hypothetical protein